jgi:hypothetical protein
MRTRGGEICQARLHRRLMQHAGISKMRDIKEQSNNACRRSSIRNANSRRKEGCSRCGVLHGHSRAAPATLEPALCRSVVSR